MKKTLPVGMGSVAYEWEYKDPTLTRPSMAITFDTEKLKGQLVVAKIKVLLPESDKYEWDVASDYSIHTMSQRLGLRLRSKYVYKDPRDNVDIYAVHDVYHLDQLISDDAYLKAVVDKLVGSLVRELARIEKEKLKHEHHKHDDLSSETEWPLPAKYRGSRLVREGKASNSEVPAKDD